jgi:hypothetical protein
MWRWLFCVMVLAVISDTKLQMELNTYCEDVLVCDVMVVAVVGISDTNKTEAVNYVVSNMGEKSHSSPVESVE